MRAAEVMTKGVETVPPGMPAADAWELMRRKSIHHLVVVDGSRVIGILSDRDAAGRSGGSVRSKFDVVDLMTSAVVTVAPDATVRKIANVMRGRSIGCVPVVDGKRLLGIVTVSDLLELVGGGVGRPSHAERHTLNYRGPHRKTKQSRRFGVW